MSSRIGQAEWIWKDGEMIPWADATVHLLSTAVQFGSSVFEGIRCYATPDGPAIFRLREHLRRLFDSATVYRMRPGHTIESLAESCIELVRINELDACYIRPMILRGYGAAGLHAVDSPIETYLAAWPWGAYLGSEALEKGVDVCTSSWTRAAPNTFPVAAKAAGHYNAAQLMKAQAVADGYSEAIALGPGGLVSEGSGQNLFLVRDGVLITPFLDGTSLGGITRDAVLQLARDRGIPIREQHVPRESLYIVDELFFTGTASEVTPIRSVDRIAIGEVGPITRALQEDFLAVVTGRSEDRHGWLTRV
ncbi:MAG: branched-chain amino acid transaminase [Gemmatimonadales bacterium]|nr:MAG: branched-chain amino acid transaminase [Gemmatimonadales bacterium]